MKHRSFCIAATALFLALPLISPAADQNSQKQLQTYQEKISYVLGREVGRSFKESPTKIEIDIFMQGLEDGLKNSKSLLTPEEEEAVKSEFTKQINQDRARKQAALSDTNLKAEKEFLIDNKSKAGVKTTASGLQYKVLRQGTGAKPQATDKVKVNYRGTLIDGTEFDSSYKRNKPAIFPVNGVIAGWTEALQLMSPGSKYRLFVPSKLAYGARGAGKMIGPNAMLIFDVELLEIVR